MPEHYNEQEIIRLAKDGNREMLSRLFQEHAAEIYTFCVRLSGNKTEAEDLSQAVFVRVFAAIKRFNGKSSFSTWVHQIAINLWKDSLRKKKRAGFISLDDNSENDDGENLVQQYTDTSLSLDKNSENMELQENIKKAIDSLSDEYRIPVVLKYIENKSLEEICRICKAPIGTVSSRLTRGIRLVRKFLSSPPIRGEDKGEGNEPQ